MLGGRACRPRAGLCGRPPARRGARGAGPSEARAPGRGLGATGGDRGWSRLPPGERPAPARELARVSVGELWVPFFWDIGPSSGTGGDGSPGGWGRPRVAWATPPGPPRSDGGSGSGTEGYCAGGGWGRCFVKTEKTPSAPGLLLSGTERMEDGLDL